MAAALWNTTGGSWTVAANWDVTNPNPPPGTLHVVPGSNDDVSVPDNSGTLTPFTVSYAHTSTIHSLTMASNTTLDIASGSLAISNGAAANASRINVAAGATISVGSGAAIVSTAGDIAGTVAGAGSYVFRVGTFNINAGANFTVASWVLDVSLNGSASKTELNTNLAYAGAFTLADFSGNHAFLDTNGNTLTLSGSGTIDGTVQGAGTVLFTGSAVLGSGGNGSPVVEKGATLEFASGASATQHLNMTLGDAATSGTVKIDAGAIYTLDQDLAFQTTVAANGLVQNAGQFRVTGAGTDVLVNAGFTSTGTVTIGSGNTLTLGGATAHTLSGTANGAGTLVVGSGTTLVTALNATVAHIHLAGGNGGGTLQLGSDLSYGGELAFSGLFDTLDLDGRTLTLGGSGSTLLGNTLMGGGTLRITGDATIGGNLDADTATAVTIRNSGLLNQNGAVTLNGTLINDTSRTWSFTGLSQINDAGAVVQNNGTLSDSVAGTSAIEADLTNAVGATIAVGAGAELVLRSGTQDLRGTLSGAGTLSFGFGADATIGTTAVTVANLKLQGGNGGAALTLGNNLTYGGTLSFAGQFDEIALNGKVLTLSGSGNSLLGNLIDGGGASRLKITGSATIGGNGQIGGAAGAVTVENAGTLNQNGTAFFTGSVINNSGRTYALTGAGNITTQASATFTNNGTLQDNAAGESAIFIGFTNNGVIALGAGATLRLAGTSVLNGSVSGAGTLFLGGGTTTLNANIDAAAWHVGGGGTVTLARNIAYAGSFLIDNGFTRLQTAGHTLTLTGPTDFQASVLDGTVGLSDRLSVTGSQIDLSALAFDHWTAGEDDILLNGTNGNDTIRGSSQDDTMTGGFGNDVYVDPGAGDAITEALGGGTDTVQSAVTFDLSQVSQQVERLTLTGTADIAGTGNALANLIAGNGGANTLNGLSGNDTLNGGAGADTLNGGAGADRLAGGTQRDKIVPGVDADADVLAFGALNDSTGVTRDVLSRVDFNAEDKIDLPIVPTAIAPAIAAGTLSTATFNADLAAAVNAAALPAGQAVLFDPNAGNLDQAGMVYLVVDANGVAGYQANADWVFQLELPSGTLDPTDFI